VGAETVCSGAWLRGAASVNQLLSFEASLNREFTVYASGYDKVCLRHGRRLHRALARYITFPPGIKAPSLTVAGLWLFSKVSSAAVFSRLERGSQVGLI
jgi:hypothetical protein